MGRLGIENASHHTLRHTGASFMLAEGISVRVVQEIGGWTSLRMLERYTHPTDAEKLRAVEAVSRLTRVGTRTGTAARSRNRRTRCASQKSLTGRQLEWRPQRDSNPCLSLERANQPDQEPTHNQRFTNSRNDLGPVQLSLDLTPDHDTDT